VEHSFGTGEPFSLGVEEELCLVAPATGALLNDSAAVLDRLDAPDAGEVEGEVLACQVELISGVCETVADAMGQLGELERAVLDTSVGVLRSGTHPSAQEGEAQVSNKERYELISSLLGDAVATPVSALHVHVGMPDPETAIRVFNGLRRHLPLLEALGANSPFRHDRDTGLASAREITLRAWARSGAPRAFASFGDFEESTEALTAVAEVPDYTFHWWKLRPHPRLGTVELRALDVQARPEHTAALVAAVQSLARHEAQAEPVAGPASEILDEASFKAARAGVAAMLPDAAGRLRPVTDLLDEAMELARPVARALGCAEELEGLTALAGQGGGAGLQHVAHRKGGMGGLLRALTRRPGD
jgi:carboxylate-amine ligase